MQGLENIQQVCSYIGTISFYCNMFPPCSHNLAPLAELTVGRTDHQQEALETMKAIIIKDCLACLIPQP
jgi:hypothetical protein